MKKVICYLALCVLCQSAIAQSVGSENTYKGFAVATGSVQAEQAETLYIGPGQYEINGTWEIYSKYLVVDPAAIITGTGTIQIYNAADAGGLASVSLVDGNASANAIGINIVLNNATGMELANKDFPADLTADGFVNNAASSAYIGQDLDLAVDGANVLLDVDELGDLRFDNDATISNYSASRMIVTGNSIISHAVKDAGGAGFFFPVGIAAGDYTPASVAGSGTYHVSVTDYSPATPVIDVPSEGMYRTWQIYGDAATSMTLYHNISTNGTDYNDATAFITQYQGDGVWSSGSPEQQAAGEHTSSGTQATSIPSISTDDHCFYTKTSDALTPLPVSFTSFNAYKNGSVVQLEWVTEHEQYNKGFEIERSPDGQRWVSIGSVESLSANGSGNSRLEYSFIDSSPLSAQNFYRLKQIDFDGQHDYSQVCMVRFDVSSRITVFPNPFKDVVTIAELSGNEEAYVYDISGKLVKQHKLAPAQHRVNLSLEHLSSGTYYILIKSKNGVVSTHKIERIK
ncbi:MAG: T9SS type A sorting domain-containing protein [Agriterribacter sp.]